MEQTEIEKAISFFATSGLKKVIQSFSEAINDLDNKQLSSKLLFYIQRYLYFGTEPTPSAMDESESAMWMLVKPYLHEIRERE